MVHVAVSSLIRTVKQLLKRSPLGVSDETIKLWESVLDSLEYISKFIVETSKRRQDSEKIKELERKIRAAADETKCMIGLKIYEFNLLEGSEVGTGSQGLCKTLLPIVEKFDAFKRELSGSSFDANEDLQSSRHVANPNIENVAVGLEDDLMKIMRRVKGPPSTREIVFILGMGGIGKTTLAKIAYDHPEIRYRFDIHVWVTVSQEYRIRNLLLCILSCISQVTNKIENETDQTNEIKKQTNDQLMDMI
ncbi:disease resistance protein RPP13-like [Lycium ferocissimum]|uniref:disease resistance protein RPP13-like n=1 Tax=Lycium ferocissimum TaxID=112874 RepID=UPI00281507F2|nr:disease resistance protein RPP13-like [Lycium ferocissimum]